MGSTVADYNGDGKLDIFKTNFSDDTATLYRNNGDGTLTMSLIGRTRLNTQYLGWGTMFLDFDNDTWPDLLLVNGHVYRKSTASIWAATSRSRESSITITVTENLRISPRTPAPESPSQAHREAWR